jgi:hypothetical protein
MRLARTLGVVAGAGCAARASQAMRAAGALSAASASQAVRAAGALSAASASQAVRALGAVSAAGVSHVVRATGVVGAVSVLLVAAASPVAAQFGCPASARPVSIGPAYLDEIDGGRALGVSGSAGWCSADYDTRPRLPRARYIGFNADGAIPFARLALPQNVQASAWAGWTVSLTERAPDVGGDLDAVPAAFRFDYGVLGFGGRVQYESRTDFDEQALAGGVEARWVNPRWRFSPSLVLAVNAVRPLTSELRDTIGAEHELHGRVALQAYWLAPIGEWLEFELDGRVFHGFGMDELVEAAGLDRGAFLAGTLGFVLRQQIGPVGLDRLYVGYAHGQQPTDAEQRKAWTLGLRVAGR